MEENNTYSLIDSGNGRKLERFGPYLLDRPAAQAAWTPQLSEKEWAAADAIFIRESDKKWGVKPHVPDAWTVSASGVTFKISLTDFGHVGLFPEQHDTWAWIQQRLHSAQAKGRKNIHALNLFAYSGGSTLAAANAGAHVCHLDASKGMVSWARENALLSELHNAPVRWIVDDVRKFLRRESQRDRRYDIIILDPPTFGRGSSGEIFKIEEDLINILEQCRDLLTDDPLFIMLSCHSPGYTPIVLSHLLTQMMDPFQGKGAITSGEMCLKGAKDVFPLPSGAYARWSADE